MARLKSTEDVHVCHVVVFFVGGVIVGGGPHGIFMLRHVECSMRFRLIKVSCREVVLSYTFSTKHLTWRLYSEKDDSVLDGSRSFIWCASCFKSWKNKQAVIPVSRSQVVCTTPLSQTPTLMHRQRMTSELCNYLQLFNIGLTLV